MKIIDGLEYLFYIALIALLIYGPPPAQDDDSHIATNNAPSKVMVSHYTPDRPASRQ
jgi:hypothetical protein